MTTGLRPDRDEVIVAAIASGHTRDQTADVAGCSRATVNRRLAIPEVKTALDIERQRLAAETADLLTGSVAAVVARLRRVVDTGTDRDVVAATSPARRGPRMARLCVPR